MRYLKRQSLNRRIANDPTLYSDVANSNVYVAPTGKGSLVVPVGTNAQQPGSGVWTHGMIRYNSQTNEFEGYQGSKWRSFKFKEASPIIQQNLGAGDSNTVYFGPLNSAYNPTNVSSNVPGSGGQSAGQYGGQNILVIVENVIQLYNTNYTIDSSPTIGGEVYTAVTSAQANIGATTIYFNTALNITGASGNGTTVTLTFPTQAGVPFSVGQSIVVSNITPSAYNGNWTVSAVTTSSVSYLSTASGTMLFPGDVAAVAAVYPATNIVGAILTGSSSIQSNTAITAISVDPATDALLSITFNKALITANISAGTTLTITEGSQAGSGYYIKFNSPPPYGKIVTALLGFDQ